MSYDHQKENPISPWFPKEHSLSNFTGNWAVLKPIINEKCHKCLRCWIFCPDSAIEFKEDIIQVNYIYCKGCGICAAVCPLKAIEMERKL